MKASIHLMLSSEEFTDSSPQKEYYIKLPNEIKNGRWINK